MREKNNNEIQSVECLPLVLSGGCIIERRLRPLTRLPTCHAMKSIAEGLYY